VIDNGRNILKGMVQVEYWDRIDGGDMKVRGIEWEVCLQECRQEFMANRKQKERYLANANAKLQEERLGLGQFSKSEIVSKAL